MKRDRVVAALRRYFAGRSGIVSAYLFGSMARGEARASGDVDVGVVLASDDYSPLFDIEDDLASLLGRPVDVVAMNEAPPDLLHRILRAGIVVHETDHRRRLEFELHARNEYFDFLPVLERYRRTVLDRV